MKCECSIVMRHQGSTSSIFLDHSTFRCISTQCLSATLFCRRGVPSLNRRWEFDDCQKELHYGSNVNMLAYCILIFIIGAIAGDWCIDWGFDLMMGEESNLLSYCLLLQLVVDQYGICYDFYGCLRRTDSSCCCRGSELPYFDTVHQKIQVNK